MAETNQNRNPHEPPFDGKPCPCCPSEIRNLAATAHNLVSRWDRARADRLPESIEELRRAVASVKPLMDAHFANEEHAYGLCACGKPKSGPCAFVCATKVG